LGAKGESVFHVTATIESPELIHNSAQIWQNSHLRSKVTVGKNTIIGSSVYVGPRVTIGNNCKIQNGSQIFDPAEINDFVFIGPGVILTNDRNPRASTPEGNIKSTNEWEPVAVIIESGASIGAGAICVAPIRIGSWSMVAAGAVVTRDVPNFALVAGVPAKQIGWVGKFGYKLVPNGDEFICPKTKSRYKTSQSGLEEIR
jgi:UDP-2-acetamido-3-amino-2,3-dideoxy-glucuronate N-acetyltransferase